VEAVDYWPWNQLFIIENALRDGKRYEEFVKENYMRVGNILKNWAKDFFLKRFRIMEFLTDCIWMIFAFRILWNEYT
jgi:hypothetical protein